MKILAVILILSIKTTVVLGQIGYSDLTTIKTECEHFTDSLISANVDTVISYYQGYAGCPVSGRPWAFIYWTQNSVPSAMIFEQRTKGKKNKKYDTYELHYYHGVGITSYSFSYFDKYFTNISADTVVEKPNLYILNYAFVQVRVKLATRHLEYYVRPDREANFTSYKWMLIKDLRSFILDYYISL